MKLEQQGFRFAQSVTTVLFDEIENIRVHSDKLDQALSDFFQTPGLTAAIGPGVDPNIPRLQFPSKFGHSLLNISNVAAQLITNVDTAWDKEFGKISAYSIERETSLEKVLSDAGTKIKWVGWSIKTQKSVGNAAHGDSSASKVIKNNFFKSEALLGQAGDPYEISHKVAFIEKDRFYLNFHASNYKIYSHKIEVKPNQRIRIVNPALRELKFEEQGVEFLLDINSKYAFDLGASAEHKSSDFSDIVGLAKNFLENNLGTKEWK